MNQIDQDSSMILNAYTNPTCLAVKGMFQSDSQCRLFMTLSISLLPSRKRRSTKVGTLVKETAYQRPDFTVT